MSTLSSSSTTAEVNASYDDNSSYFEDRSVAKARAFVTAVTILMRRRAARVTHSGEDIELQSLREEKQAAEGYIASNAAVEEGGAGVKHVSFADYRS